MNTRKIFTATAMSALLLTAAGCKEDDEKENAVQREANRTEIVETQTPERTTSSSGFGGQNGGYQTLDSFKDISVGSNNTGAAQTPPPTSQENVTPRETEVARTNGTGSKFEQNPYAQVTQQDMLYQEIQGNEFTMIFRTAVFPEGREVTIDPDDMMPVNDPRKDGRVVLAPRQRFFYEINNQLPAIPGREMARLGPNEGLSPKGSSTMYKHLTDDPMLGRSGEVIGGGHGIPRDQIEEAMLRTHEARGIPEPE